MSSGHHQQDFKTFFTDQAVVAAFENHVAAVLNHKNALTGVHYKDDPTILAWENCNMCGIGVVWTSPSTDLAPYLSWTDVIGKFIKSIDARHLYVDNSGLFRFDKRALDAKTPDIITSEYYPHWDALVSTGQKTTAQTFSQDAAATSSTRSARVRGQHPDGVRGADPVRPVTVSLTPEPGNPRSGAGGPISTGRSRAWSCSETASPA